MSKTIAHIPPVLFSSPPLQEGCSHFPPLESTFFRRVFHFVADPFPQMIFLTLLVLMSNSSADVRPPLSSCQGPPPPSKKGRDPPLPYCNLLPPHHQPYFSELFLVINFCIFSFNSPPDAEPPPSPIFFTFFCTSSKGFFPLFAGFLPFFFSCRSLLRPHRATFGFSSNRRIFPPFCCLLSCWTFFFCSSYSPLCFLCMVPSDKSGPFAPDDPF